MPNKPQIFAFTYAGGTAAFFDGIEKELPELAWVKPDYPGHGARRKEAFCGSFDRLGDDLFARFREAYAGGHYALFGYSMGAIALCEVLRRILAAGEPAPERVFLAAHEPRTKAELAGYREDELDEWVKERTIRFGGIPQKLIGNQSFWRMYLPLYRADYTLIGRYRFEALDLRTEIPATIFYSGTDTPRREMEAWRRIFTGECEFAEYSGTHFFIQEHHREMAEIIRERMAPADR